MNPWTTKDIPDQGDRTIIITGASSGIGRIAAIELVRAGANVIAAVRNIERAEQALANVTGKIEIKQLDLSSLASIRAFAGEIKNSFHVLINNAGIMAVPQGKTEDGFELQIGTNHFGHFALTGLLMGKTTDRIVTVSSIAHRAGTIDFSDINFERRKYSNTAAYAQSKLANILFSKELQRRLDNAGLSVRSIAAHPGLCKSNLHTEWQRNVWMNIADMGHQLIAQSTEHGALPVLYAATMDIPGGSYIGPGGVWQIRGYPKIVSPSQASNNIEAAEALWRLSEKLTGVRIIY
ncbi:MAG: SDR family NAD(P)-dependent oxidoreductase [Proteobacteria bacterium]|nr:SDR family NAD(P)-dependent oxidoreductase [Pseudomonadota bacterium]